MTQEQWIEQADREAAAQVVHDSMIGGLNWMHAKSSRDTILAGKWDHHPTVQAFARHRQQAVAAEIGEPLTTASSLNTIANIIQGWLDWDENYRRQEGLNTEDGTHIMVLPVPVWPTHGALQNWVKALRSHSLTEAQIRAAERERIVGLLRAKSERLDATATDLRDQGLMLEWAGTASCAVTTRMNADDIADAAIRQMKDTNDVHNL